jgi:hypothetical protein
LNSSFYFSHDAGEFDINTEDIAGPDGCLSSSGDNRGLGPDDKNALQTYWEPMWQKYCGLITRADFWALIGKLVTEQAANRGAQATEINVPYFWGRPDNTEGCETGKDAPDGPDGSHHHRLPANKLGIDEVKRVFVTQMGLTMADAGKTLHILTPNHAY